jgi:hypothetical protein
VLADDRLGRPPVLLGARLLARGGRRGAEGDADVAEPASHARQRGADVLVALERLLEGHGEPLGAPDRDRPVHERDGEALGQRGPDAAAAGAVRRGEGHDRHGSQNMGHGCEPSPR